MKKRMLVKVLLFFAVTMFLTGNSMAADSTDVRVEAAEPVIVDGRIYVDTWITFSNLSLYNNEVYFSYHLVDSEGNMLRFENTRYQISLDDSKCFITILLPLSEVETLDKPILRFDLVDMKNEYWFLYSESVVLDAEDVCLPVASEWESIEITQDVSEEDTEVVGHRGRFEIFPLMYSLAGWGVAIWLFFLYLRRTSAYRKTHHYRYKS